MKMTKAWNRNVYRLWAPIYDVIVNHFFMPARRRALELLAPQFGDQLLIVGVGTGVDLPLLPGGVEAVGIDLSSEMLAQARKKPTHRRVAVGLVQGDAQSVLVAEQSFDAAILVLILSVVPDAQACLQSGLLALNPGGRAVIFDKFQPDGERLSRTRQVLNHFSTLLGTDITRRYGEIAQDCLCEMTHDEPSLLGGLYRVILLKKRPDDCVTSARQGMNTSASSDDGPPHALIDRTMSAEPAAVG